MPLKFEYVLPSAESQRDSATKPRVARNELPWVAWPMFHNPNGGCGLVVFPAAAGHNPFRVVLVRARDPRVARSSQPWALLRNPFGIEDAGKVQRLTGAFACHTASGEASFVSPHPSPNTMRISKNLCRNLCRILCRFHCRS